MKHKIFSQDGFSLPELVVTLAVLGLITVSLGSLTMNITKSIRQRQYEAECTQILESFLDIHNKALMDNTQMGSSATAYSNSIIFGYYPVSKYTIERSALSLKYVTVKGAMLYKRIGFNPTGTISTGCSLELYGPDGQLQFLVIQPVTGRIYLTHDRP